MALLHAQTMLNELMYNLVARIAEGEGLDVEELSNKYLGAAAKPIEIEKKKTRAAKVTVTKVRETVVTKCTAVTAKGKPCRLNAVEGTCMCSVHMKKKGEEKPVSDDDEAGPSAPSPPPAPKKKKPAKKKLRLAAPEHTHELDGTVHSDCELCQTHGNELAVNENENEEFETVMSPRRSLRDRLMEVAAEEDYDEE
jgi:hypothetical protein